METFHQEGKKINIEGKRSRRIRRTLKIRYNATSTKDMGPCCMIAPPRTRSLIPRERKFCKLS